MNILETKNLHKIYDESTVPVHAVNGIDLTIKKGEFTAIVGPSGSGKTTLLNMIGGLDRPSQGEIIVNGVSLSAMFEDIGKAQRKRNHILMEIAYYLFFIWIFYFIISIPKRLKSGRAAKKLTDFRLKNIGFVFQAYNLIPVLTAKENVEFIMHLQGRPKQERDQRTINLLKAVGLGERIDARPNKLSGGQQQRVAVSRAIASKPQFVLADEPTANLDSKSTENLLEMMEQLNREEEITFIFSTHDQRVVKKARRVITVDDGKIVSDETKNP